MKAKLLTLSLTIFASISLWAQTSGTCGLSASWTIDNGTLTISGSGEMFDYSSASNRPWRTILIDTIKIENGITSIGNYAFSNCGCTDVTIPNSVTRIGNYAFSNCGCTDVTIPNSVTRIGDQAFAGCYNLSTISIPNSVTSIGFKAFTMCTNLISPVYNDYIFAYMPPSYQGEYSIPEGIETILNYAFENCSCITKITIPKSVRIIEENTFRGCDILTHVIWNAKTCNDVKFYNTTTILNSSPFSSPIVTFEFGDSVQYIPSYLCCGMMHLSTIILPQSVTSIGKCAFSGCSGLSSIIIPENVLRIEDNAFENCSGLTTITIPKNVTKLGKKAFSNCINIKSVFWDAKNALFTYTQNGVVNDSHPFYSIRDSISSFIFGDSVETISDGMCYGMKKLESVFIPQNVNYCGLDAFKGCLGLRTIIVDSLNPTYDSRDSCNAIIESATNKLIKGFSISTIPYGVTNIGEFSFASCKALTTISIPNSVTTIENCAFYSCKNLKHITIPSSVQNIESSAFHSCDSLVSVSLMDGVRTIGSAAFQGCYKLSSISIPNSVTSIDRCAFSGCSGMRFVSIGNNVGTIPYLTFDGCTTIDTITCYRTYPPTIVSGAFNNVPTTAIVYVPAESITQYENSSSWGRLFSDFRPIEGGSTELEVEKMEITNATLNELLENSLSQIFTLQGNKVYKNTSLPAGIYVVQIANKSYKLFIR